MLNLENVTLWACVWTPDEALIHKTFRAVRHCTRLAKFGEVVFFCCKDPAISSTCGWRVVRIKEMTIQQWNLFVNREVPKHINTPFAMSVHEDGFIIEPSLWTDEFLKYDYIGAPWEDGVVGNQGFCIESRKIMDAKLKLPFNGGDMASDLFICRKHRGKLESSGVRFAPTPLAEKFSTELYGDTTPSFGFHGRTCAHNKYSRGWQAITETEKVQSVALFYPYVVNPVSTNRQEFDDCSRRFVDTYKRFPAGIDHTIYVVCCNGVRDSQCEQIFSGVNVVFDQYDGGGWDIGCEQYMARKVDADFVIGMTTRSYFHREGWLRRFIEARNQYGEGLYGATGSYENFPHIRTAFYGVDRWIYQDYPYTIDSRNDGFKFESLHWNFTNYVAGLGYPCIMVTWDGCYTKPHWRKAKNIFRSGDQSNMLVWDRHSLIYQQADVKNKQHLKACAEGRGKKIVL